MPLDQYGLWVPGSPNPAVPTPDGGGTGSPEGVVIGSPFDEYVDTNSNTLYKKTSGENTTTGWVVISGGGGGGGTPPSGTGFTHNTGGVQDAASVGETGTGNVVRATSPAIVTPTIASFANSAHNHSDAAGGGVLTAAAIANLSPTFGVVTASSYETSGPGAGSIELSDGTTFNLTLVAQAMSANANVIFDTAAATGFWLGTASGETETLTHVGFTGTGTVVRTTSPTIVTPTIASFANATHSHQDAAGGGALAAAAITSGQFAIARLASGTPDGTKFIRDDGVLATPSGSGGAAGGPIFDATADATVGNTGTETSIVGSGSGNATLAANSMSVGKAYRGIYRGRYSTKAVTPGTLQIKVKLGSTVIIDTGAQTVPSASTDKLFDIDFDFSVRSTGASGTVWAQGKVLIGDTTGLVPQVYPMLNTAVVTVDTTASQLVDVTATWGTADAGNTVTGSLAILSDGQGLGSSVLGVTSGGTGGATAVAALDSLITAEADVASATTTDLGAQTTQNVRITGTTTITGLGTATAGIRRWGRFAGILTFTHNATSLILPSAANITTAANDRFIALSLGSGNWLIEDYVRADGTALVASSASISDTAFASSWDGETTTAPSKNAVYDLLAGGSFGEILTKDFDGTLKWMLPPTIEEFAQAGTIGPFGWSSLAANSGLGYTGATGTADHPGLASGSTGALTNGQGGFRSGNTHILFGAATRRLRWRIQTPTALSDGTDRYIIYIGFGDTSGGVAETTDGAYFKYTDDDTAGNGAGKWDGKTSNNGVRTYGTGGSAVTATAASWWDLGIIATSSSVSFYVSSDGGVTWTLIGTSAANIPSTTGREFGLTFGIAKTAGTNARVITADRVSLW